MRRADFEAVLSFLADVSHLEFDEPYPIDFLALLESLVPCDAVTYQELDHAKRSFAGVGLGPDDEVDIDVYWSTGPCPTMGYRERTGDLRAIRTSDLIDRLRYHELPIYREYFRPSRLEHIVDLGLPALPGRRRSFVLFRALGSSDFSERDRDVLEMLRPHLYQIEAHAALRRELGEALREPIVDGEHDRYAALTPREHEIVQLVSSGKTNAEIATELWIAPSTVKSTSKTSMGRSESGGGPRSRPAPGFARSLRTMGCIASGASDSIEPHACASAQATNTWWLGLPQNAEATSSWKAADLVQQPPVALEQGDPPPHGRGWHLPQSQGRPPSRRSRAC